MLGPCVCGMAQIPAPAPPRAPPPEPRRPRHPTSPPPTLLPPSPPPTASVSNRQAQQCLARICPVFDQSLTRNAGPRDPPAPHYRSDSARITSPPSAQPPPPLSHRPRPRAMPARTLPPPRSPPRVDRREVADRVGPAQKGEEGREREGGRGRERGRENQKRLERSLPVFDQCSTSI